MIIIYPTRVGHRGPLTGQTLSCPVRRQLSGVFTVCQSCSQLSRSPVKTLDSQTSAGIPAPTCARAALARCKQQLEEWWTFKWREIISGIHKTKRERERESAEILYTNSEGSRHLGARTRHQIISTAADFYMRPHLAPPTAVE